MNCRHGICLRNASGELLALAVLLALVCGGRAAGQTKPIAAVTRSTWTAPRAHDGHPDVQGVWSFQNLTPLERPAEYAEKTELQGEELARFVQFLRDQNNKDTREGAGNDRDVSRAYNDFWWDFGTRASQKTSLITDPPSGRRPAFTADAEENARRSAARMRRPAEGPEDRSLAERCMMGFNSGPPMLPSAYNNNVQIIQSADFVVVRTEMIHDARIIPLDGRPHLNPAIHLWLGDSRGRWEGETLVVETTNFRDTTHTTVIGANRGSSDKARLIERFRRVAPDALEYEFTIDDPKTYVKPWTAVVPMTKIQEQIYEYACHEGNYGLEGILSGARAGEGNAVSRK